MIQSNGFQLESSLIRSAKALERLCCVLALTTLYLVAQGTAVVTPRQTPLGRRALVSWPELPENRLELGQTCPQQGLRAHHQHTSIPRQPILHLPWPQKSSTRNHSQLFLTLEFQDAIA